ncbi:hypothetical protein MTO96_028007 [Rhipicephalus appendiculatus]
MNEYAFELPVPTEGISAQDIYHDKGAAPEKMNEIDESPTTKSKQEYDHYDDCDLYYDDDTQREIPFEPLKGSQLLGALKTKHVCDTIPADVLVNDTRRVTSDRWPDDAWWSWFELYGGHITCTDGLIWKESECVVPWGDERQSCYSLCVAVSDPKHDDGAPLALVEAGFASRTMRTTAFWLLVTILAIDGSFRILPLCVLETMIGELVFQNSTITWNGKELDSKDPLFRGPIRHALWSLVRAFMWDPLVDSIKKAFGDTSSRSHPLV